MRRDSTSGVERERVGGLKCVGTNPRLPPWPFGGARKTSPQNDHSREEYRHSERKCK
jgi:hypothetical protein